MYDKITIEDLLDCLPQNIPLYKDSGLWQFRSDNMEEVIAQQGVYESLKDFIIRYFKTFEYDSDVMTNFVIKQLNENR